LIRKAARVGVDLDQGVLVHGDLDEVALLDPGQEPVFGREQRHRVREGG